MALEAHGGEFFWSTATSIATAATNLVDEVISWSGPSGGAAVIDVTHLKSTAHDKLQGLPDEGNITLELNLSSQFAYASTGSLSGMKRSRDARTVGHFTLKPSANVVCHGLAFVTTMTPSGAVDDKISLSVAVEITGQASWGVT